MPLTGQVIVITGASRGLGEAVANRLVRDGAHLVLGARDAAALESVADGILPLRATDDQQVVHQRTDVADPGDVKRLVERATQITGRVDALISNAGVYGPMGPSEEVAWDEWVQAININLMGTVLACRAVVPVMRRQGGGKIVLLSGGGATAPLPRLSAYAASKAAVVRFGETLAQELKADNIAVNSVAPGALNTRLLDQVLGAGPDTVGPEFHARALRQQETGGTPLETPAELIAFLVSSASDGISGRLLSAVWDDWQHLAAQRDRLATSDVYTLRRIVPEDRDWGKD
jgi:NAD(P)-dependent dehydrogenase (short-subunit alcohol dehydrogenase family)